MSNFIYLKETRMLLNIDRIIALTISTHEGFLTEAVIGADKCFGLKEDLNYVKELVYEAQFKKQEQVNENPYECWKLEKLGGYIP